MDDCGGLLPIGILVAFLMLVGMGANPWGAFLVGVVTYAYLVNADAD